MTRRVARVCHRSVHSWPSAVRAVAALSSVVAALTLSLAVCGCSKGLSQSGAAAQDTSPVIAGTTANHLPAPPPQSQVNQYVALDLLGINDVSMRISHPDKSYFYQQLVSLSAQGSNGGASGGVIQPFADLNYFSETDSLQAPYTFAGLNAENEGGFAILADGVFSAMDMQVGVPAAQAGCLAPDGSASFNFLQILSTGASTSLVYQPATDALYGSVTLNYSKSGFAYAGAEQFALGGAAATTSVVPFGTSYCVQTIGGYALQSASSKGTDGAQGLLTYLGPTGTLVGEASYPEVNSIVQRTGIVGMIQPDKPIDLAAVTAGSYKGFYAQPETPGSGPGLAYFGVKSHWITSPVFHQTGTTLVGGNLAFSNFVNLYSPPAPIPGNIVLDFGAEDSKHPGLFPSATIKEQDPSNLCKSSQQSTGPDGNVYCSFPVVALVTSSYGKYTIFVAGPEATLGEPLFYALTED